MPPKTQVHGTIGIIAQETARYSQFAVSLANLAARHPGWAIKTILGYDAAYARHRLAEQMEGDYLLFLDDDHAFQPDLLERLLDHRKDIVAPLYLKRGQGFRPTAYEPELDLPLILDDDPPGLRAVSATGTSGMLIHRRVFEELGAPFFRAGHVHGMPHAIGEDIDFCNRAQAAGFEVWCDTSIPFGHYCAAMVLPVQNHDGSWSVALSMGDTVIKTALSQEYAHVPA